MIYRAKAPLRIGLAGGGTDVSPYADDFSGAILNATISLFAYSTIKVTNNKKIKFIAPDKGWEREYESTNELKIDGEFDLHKGVYNRIVKEYKLNDLSFELTTWVDAPAGSGLGTSSTLTVSILGAFAEWLKLPLGEYDVAHLAYEIERIDLNMAGGRQDQYAATFGGFNFMEFGANDKVIVNPLRIRSNIKNELNNNIVLYYTGTSRLSAKIINAQTKNINSKKKASIEGMHNLKKQAQEMKESILKGELEKVGDLLNFGWQSKKQLTKDISNQMIDEIYDAAIKSGATGGKISGAGGGGFMMFYCPENTRYDVIKTLETFGGRVKTFNFSDQGMISWKTK